MSAARPEPTGPEHQGLHQPFELPAEHRRILDDLFAGDQLLQRLGIRGMVTGAASGDAQEFANALRRLNVIFETKVTEGYRQGRQHRFPALCAYVVTGYALGAAMMAVALAVLTG